MSSKKRTRRRQFAAIATGAAFLVVAVGVWVAGVHVLAVVLVVFGFLVTVGALGEVSPRRTTRTAPRRPRRRRWDGIFSDSPAPELMPAEVKAGERAAHRAAFRAKGSWSLTKRRSYGLYRGDADDRFLDWPRWRDAYLSEYNKDGPLDVGSNDRGTGTAGAEYFT